MPPIPVTFPERTFVLTQTVNGIETNVMVSTPLADNFTSDSEARASVLQSSLSLKNANPGVLYKIYSPSNGGPHTDGDCVWRSDIDYAGAI